MKNTRTILTSHINIMGKLTLCGNMLLICFFAWYCSATILPKYSYAKIAVLVFTVFVSCFYLYIFKCIFKSVERYKKLEKEKHQMICLNPVIMFTSFLFLVVTIVDNNIGDKSLLVCSIILFFLTTIVAEIQVLLHYIKNRAVNIICKKKIYCTFGFLFLLFTCFYLLITYNAYPFKWDAALYYTACENINLFSLSSTAIYGHTAQTFGILMKILTTVLGSVTSAAYFMNLSVYMFSVVAFYGILKYVFPEKKKIIYIILTAVYALNPFSLGMVCYLNLDFLCQSLFMVLLYYMVKKEWIYFSVVSILFCFTKEPAIVIYAFLCLGILIWEYLDKRKEKEFSFFRLFCSGKFWLMFIIGIIWIMIYKILGPWSAGNGGTEIEFEYIIEKLKVLYILNFNWILFVLAIFFLGTIIVKRKREFKWVIPIVSAQIGFTIFSCIFKTVNHPRYSDCNIIVLCILGCSLFMIIPKEKIQLLFSFLLACLMSISVLWTIDPVSKKVFTQVNIGNTNMLTTNLSGLIGDAAIYNRQMSYMEVPLCEALSYSFENDCIVFWPTQDNCPWYFDGMTEYGAIKGQYIKKNIYWDNVKKRRILNQTKNIERKEIYEVTDEVVIEDVIKQENIEQSICYIYMDVIGEGIANEIKNGYTLINEKDFTYNGWCVHLIQFKEQKRVKK